jgi:RAD54-like protein 2
MNVVLPAKTENVFFFANSGRRVLCIVPINTIQNWMAEFNHWVPSPEEVVST